MKHYNQQQTQDYSEPRRPLRADFASYTMRHAQTAKRRSDRKNYITVRTKELFSMKKSIKFIRTIPGAALAVAVVATGSVGAYALTNWFGGDVSVSQKDLSAFSVDLSSCKGNLPPGVEPTSDRHNVQFKIMGSPHVSAQDLQNDLLGMCESSAVIDFYGQKFPDAGFSSTGQLAQGTHGFKYLLLPATVTAMSNGTITLSSTGVKGDSFKTQTFMLSADVSVYNASKSAALRDVQKGDHVMFIAYAPSVTAPLIEGTSVLDQSDVRIVSVFKTQYNGGATSSLDYQKANVMPLDSYNQLHQD